MDVFLQPTISHSQNVSSAPPHQSASSSIPHSQSVSSVPHSQSVFSVPHPQSVSSVPHPQSVSYLHHTQSPTSTLHLQVAATTITQCPHCHLSLDSSEAFNSHLLTHAPVMQGSPCRYCGKVYFTEESLSAHQSTHVLENERIGSQDGSMNAMNSTAFQTNGGVLTLQPSISSSYASVPQTSVSGICSQQSVVNAYDILTPVMHSGLESRSQVRDANLPEQNGDAAVSFSFNMTTSPEPKCDATDLDQNITHSENVRQFHQNEGLDGNRAQDGNPVQRENLNRDKENLGSDILVGNDNFDTEFLNATQPPNIVGSNASDGHHDSVLQHDEPNINALPIDPVVNRTQTPVNKMISQNDQHELQSPEETIGSCIENLDRRMQEQWSSAVILNAKPGDSQNYQSLTNHESREVGSKKVIIEGAEKQVHGAHVVVNKAQTGLKSIDDKLFDEDNKAGDCDGLGGEVEKTAEKEQQMDLDLQVEDEVGYDMFINNNVFESEEHVTGNTVLNCSQCDQQFKTHRGLQRHVSCKHKMSASTKCDAGFRTAAQLANHMKIHNTSSQHNKRRCSLPRQAANKVVRVYTVSNEVDIDSELEWTPSGRENHLCEHCEKSFKSLKALNMHKLCHKRPRRGQHKSTTSSMARVDSLDASDSNSPLKCNECKKTFKTKKGFAYHTSNVHVEGSKKDAHEVNKSENSMCDICEMSFQTSEDLSKHVKSDHRERKYVCNNCGKAFLVKSHLLEHERRHGEADIPCPKCNKKFKCEADLRKHQRAHSDNKPFMCKTCGKSFKATNHLLEHELRHGEAKFTCQYCDKKYFIEREMLKHVKIHTSKTYPCQHCSEEFREKQNLKEHILEHEEQGTTKQFICSHCNLYFSSEKGLLHHLNNKHRDLLKQEEQWQSICDVCNRVCSSNEALRHHKRIHIIDRMFPCSICDKVFKSAQHLQEHEKRHGEPALTCSICDLKFVLQSDLKKHQKRHMMKKTIPCTKCEKKFTTNAARNAHMKTHGQSASTFVCMHCKLGFRSNLGLKYHMNHKHYETLPISERWSHLCDHCNQVFPSESSMLRHKKMQGKFTCQFCNHTFRTEKAQKQHEQIHLGVRSHCCGVCGKGFMKSQHLVEHMKRHGEGNHSCKLCNKKYVFLTDLRKHMKLSHFSPKLETCVQCDKTFPNERTLRQHILLHHQAPVEKKHVCHDCNLQFSERKGLLSHMNNKHREKLLEKDRWKFKCQKCNRLCRSAKALEAHRQVHSNKRPHECSQCGKRFKEARHLVEHKMRHGEGQYPCPNCDKKYVFKRDLKKHVKTHFEEKKFKCTECNKSFATNTDLNYHLLRHEQAKKNSKLDRDRTIYCFHCNLKFVQKKGLDAHMNNKHRELLDEDERWPFWCEKCKKAFRTKVAMKKHEPEHLGKRDFMCSVCHKTFKEARHLAEHERRHEKPTLQCQFCDKKYVFERELQKHEEKHGEERPFKCTKCIRQYMLQSALETHMKQHEYTVAKFVCSFCTLGFISNKCLQNHLNNNHRDQLKPSEQWTNICKFCSKAYPTEEGLKKHEKVHRSLKVHCCKVCGKHFKLMHHLKQHEKRHQEGELECEYCHKKYVFASDLRKHVRIHTGEKPFTCEYCGKRFRVSGGLRKHLRLHEQSKLAKPSRPHKCQMCKKTFRYKEKFTEHLKVHGEKQFICDICNKKFCFEKTLQRHVLIHNAVKAHSCRLCSRQFADEVALNRHLEKHEKGLLKMPALEKLAAKKFQCSCCPLSFVSEYKRKYHMHIKHKDALQSMNDSDKWKHICHVCDKPFATERAWQKHEATHKAKQQKLIQQCMLCSKSFQTSQQFAEHEKWHTQQVQNQQQPQQQHYVLCKFCSKAFTNIIELKQHESSHTADGIVTVPLHGDVTYRQDGLVQVSLRETGLESTSNQQVSRTDGQFELLAELISATSNILTLNN